MCNFETIQNNNYTAVFVNENNAIPKSITPLGIYSLIGGLAELCRYDYLFENTVIYSILKWESREPIDSYSLGIMITILEQQKAFKNLIKK
jgi:hypothetical protein